MLYYFCYCEPIFDTFYIHLKKIQFLSVNILQKRRVLYLTIQNFYGYNNSYFVRIFALLFNNRLLNAINTQNMASFCKKIRDTREVKGFSQAELARQISSHHSIIGKYECDEVKPTVDVIKKLAEVLDTTISFLMGETENQNVLKAL